MATSGRSGAIAGRPVDRQALAEPLSAAPITSSSGCHSFRSWQGARFEPRHLQQILHEPVQPLRLLTGGLQQLLARLGIQPRAVFQNGADGPGDRGERRAQVVGHRAEQRVPQALAFDSDLRLTGLLGEVRPLDGERGLIAERFELMELLRRIQECASGRPDPEHAHRSLRSEQRQVEGRRAGQRRRAQAGQLPVLEDPPATPSSLASIAYCPRARARAGRRRRAGARPPGCGRPR